MAVRDLWFSRCTGRSTARRSGHEVWTGPDGRQYSRCWGHQSHAELYAAEVAADAALWRELAAATVVGPA
jgi:hypothetical protein